MFIFLSLISCKKRQDLKSENLHKIITVLSDTLIKPIPPPPPPNLVQGEKYIHNKQDSLNTIKRFNEYKVKTQIIAFYQTTTMTIHPKKIRLNPSCIDYKILLDDFYSIQEKKEIDISKIKIKRNDSLIYFKEDLLEKGQKDFEKFNILLTFSNAIFNEKYDKAIIIGSINFSKLAGVKTLYFLEKKDNKWKIKCEKGLSIS